MDYRAWGRTMQKNTVETSTNIALSLQSLTFWPPSFWGETVRHYCSSILGHDHTGTPYGWLNDILAIRDWIPSTYHPLFKETCLPSLSCTQLNKKGDIKTPSHLPWSWEDIKLQNRLVLQLSMICFSCAISASLTKIKGVPNVLRIESQRAKNFDQSGELFVSISIDFNIHFNKVQYISKKLIHLHFPCVSK